MQAPGAEGIGRYCDLLEEIKWRIKSVQAIMAGQVPLSAFSYAAFADEFVFLQIRKILEQIAFGSMSSNIELYRKQYQEYSGHWRAKKILEMVEAVNPDFYPRPLKPGAEMDHTGKFILEPVNDGFLTKDEFRALYDACSQVIHAPNPHAEAKQLDLGRSIDDWMHRIASLLWFHQIRLAGSDEAWLVYLIHPDTGRARALKTVSRRPAHL